MKTGMLVRDLVSHIMGNPRYYCTIRTIGMSGTYYCTSYTRNAQGGAGDRGRLRVFISDMAKNIGTMVCDVASSASGNCASGET